MAVNNKSGHGITDVLPPASDQSQVASAPAPFEHPPANVQAQGVKNPRLKGPKV